MGRILTFLNPKVLRGNHEGRISIRSNSKNRRNPIAGHFHLEESVNEANLCGKPIKHSYKTPSFNQIEALNLQPFSVEWFTGNTKLLRYLTSGHLSHWDFSHLPTTGTAQSPLDWCHNVTWRGGPKRDTNSQQIYRNVWAFYRYWSPSHTCEVYTE